MKKELNEKTKEEIDDLLNKMGGYIALFSDKIQKKLPVGSGYEREDVEQEVRKTFIELINRWRPVNDDIEDIKAELSIESYCFQWGYLKTLERLLRKIPKITFKDESYKPLIVYENCLGYEIAHQYGYYDFEEKTSINDELEQRDFLRRIKEIPSDEKDRRILSLFYSDKEPSLRSIGREVNLSHPAVKERLRKIYERMKECA